MNNTIKLLLCVLLLASCTLAFGQAQSAAEKTVLFHWYTPADHEWGTGGFYAGLGLVGALVTVFSLIGGVIPGTAGKARIDAEQAHLDMYYQRLSQLMEEEPPNTDAITASNDAIKSLRDGLRQERWRQFAIGFVLYSILGAFFASALAQDPVQAIVLGAGWTSFLGVLGLKGDFAQRKSVKDATLEQAEQLMKSMEAGMQQSVGSGDGGEHVSVFEIPRIRNDIRIAKQL